MAVNEPVRNATHAEWTRPAPDGGFSWGSRRRDYAVRPGKGGRAKRVPTSDHEKLDGFSNVTSLHSVWSWSGSVDAELW